MLLSACGDLPEPFMGNPGATARRLAVPVTPLLAVPPVTGALLPKQAERDYATLLASRLADAEVPTLAREPRRNDWRLAITAQRVDATVVPHYAVLDPRGRDTGGIDGAAFPAADWDAAASKTLEKIVDDAVPKVLAVMTSIKASRERGDPAALVNRAAKLYIPQVTGAPGDGDTALTRLIRARLTEFGPMVQVTPENADFTVKGDVAVSPLPKSRQQIEVTWTITRPNGHVTGKVAQLNSLPAGMLTPAWGDVAVAVAQEAAGGIFTIVERFIGREPPKDERFIGREPPKDERFIGREPPKDKRFIGREPPKAAR